MPKNLYWRPWYLKRRRCVRSGRTRAWLRWESCRESVSRRTRQTAARCALGYLIPYDDGPGAYTIRIFVADGDPDGVRIIDRMNWTGSGIVFPRTQWPRARLRKELDRVGVYVLIGPDEDDEDLQRVYVGEGDGIRDRIESHDQKKEFWSWGVAFSSNANGLNKAHVQWLEYKLVQLAREAEQCTLDNAQTPQKPALSEHEEADVEGFLTEVLRILPLVGLRAFEKPRPIVPVKSAPQQVSIVAPTAVIDSSLRNRTVDTVVVPAKQEGFDRVFIGQNAWHAIRISGAMLDKIKHIAAYQGAPISAVTYVADVKQIEPYGDSGKYKLIFTGPARKVTPIPFADAPRLTSSGESSVARVCWFVAGIRYATASARTRRCSE
jgi:hypothetical protein